MKRVSGILALAIVVLAMAITVHDLKPAAAQGGARGGVSYGYLEIADKATHQIVTGTGNLHAIVVNNAGSSWTAQVFDNTACSGTAIAGATAFTIPAAGSNLLYDVYFAKGLCIITAGTTAGSITVSFN